MNITVHHLHGDGFAPVVGSVDVREFGKLVDKYPDATWTFDDRLVSQELAIGVLDRKGIRGKFFVVGMNTMEQDRMTRERMGADFYEWFFGQFSVRTHPNFDIVVVPNDFLAQFSFYSFTDRLYRYIRDISHPAVHDVIMAPLRQPIDQLDLAKIAHHEIGLHSFSHPRRISQLSADEQFAEYRNNLGLVPGATSMAHPMGDYSPTTLEVLRGLGITEGYRADERAGATSLELPRTDINLL